MLKRLVTVAVLAVLASPFLFAPAFAKAPAGKQDEFNDEVRKLLDEGISLYKRGKYDEAHSKFETAFQKKPNSDLVYAFLQRAGTDLVASMMNAPDKKMQEDGHRLFELAKPGEPLREGKKVVMGYIDDLKQGKYEVWKFAFEHLRNYGAWAIRFYIDALKNQQQDQFRSRVMVLLTQLGVDATLAVAEALNSKDTFMKQNAAIVLGNIKDERAIPPLKRIYEDPKEPPEVKKFANEALQKITRKPSGEWRLASDYYYELAEKYYYSHPSVILSWQRYFLIWDWDAEKDILTERHVTRFLYHSQLSEQALYRLMELDPNYQDADKLSLWSLFVMDMFAQALEAEYAIASGIQALKNDEITRDELAKVVADIEGLVDRSSPGQPDTSSEELKTLKSTIGAAANNNEVETYLMKRFSFSAKILRSNVLANLPGKQYVYEALARSLKDGNALVAKACIEVIKEMGRPEDLPAPATTEAPKAEGEDKKESQPVVQSGSMGYPLIDALTNEDKRVRYAAAEAMVKLNPQSRKLGMELVIPNLIDALGEQGVRVALVIYDVQDDADRNFVNGLRKTLISLNTFPVIATSGQEGVIRAKSFPSADVIIIQKKIAGQIYFKETDTKKPVVESVFDTLRDDVRTRNMPRVLLCDNETDLTAAKTEFAMTAQGWIKKDTHKLDLQKLLEDIFNSPEAKKDSKDRADQISKSAAETFASIDPTNTIYPFRDAVDPLIKTVSPEILREDFIRIPAAKALGRYGDTRAIDVLTKVLADRAQDAEKVARQKPIRWQCAKSASMIFSQSGIAPAKEVFDAFAKVCTSDGDYDIELTAGEALGNSKLTHEQHRDLAKMRRVKRETYTSEADK